MNALKQFFCKLQGSAYIAYHLIEQTRIPYLPPEQLQARRDKHVRSIVQYAAETVPFYRDLFKTRRLDPRDFRTASDLAHLPIIEKQQIQAESARFVSDSPEGQTAFCMPTSGTSGLQLNVYQCRKYILANAAWGERQLAAVRELLGPSLPFRQASVSYPNNSQHKVRGQIRANAFVINRAGVRMPSLLEPLETIIAEINQLRPNVLTAYGTFIELLFKTIKAQGIQMHLPKVIVYVSDHLTEDTRQMIETEFGIPVLSIYSAVEAFKIGFTCPHRTGFHLHSDLAHVRIVDDNGEDVCTGEIGDIVISNLMNRGTVLLNYRIEDRGQLSEAACPCGRTLPLLAKLEGRRDDVIQLPDGNYLHSATVWLALRDNPDFIQYQLIQHTLDRFELKLVTADQSMFDRVGADLMSRLQPVLGPTVTLTATYVSPFVPFGERKRSQLVSLLNKQI